MPSISIVGIGRMGGALAIALSRVGFEIDTLIHRDASVVRSIERYLSPNVRTFPMSDVDRLDSDIVIISTADPDIEPTAIALMEKLSPAATVLHTSGSLSSEILSDLRTSDRQVGSLHPLVSISDPVTGAEKFAGVFFCVEGDDKAVATARSLAEALGGRTFSIAPEYKALYHGAAVTSAGHLVALIDLAIAMLVEAGVDRATAKQVLLPLVESTVSNLETQSPAQALTGSFARADAAAIERHLASFKGPLADRIRAVYVLLGEHSLELAESNGIDQTAVERTRQAISIAKRKTGC